MQDIDININGTRVTIDFSHSGLSASTLDERLADVIPLLCALLSADDTWIELNADEVASRNRGCIAINMLCQASINNAKKYAELLQKIANGRELISNHGFPEFSD
jgi:hypothetical protein